MQLAEPLAVGGFGFLEIADGAFAEEETEHGADAAASDRQAGVIGRVLDAVDQGFRRGGELLVAAGLLEQFQGLDAGRHGQRVAAEGPGLIHRTRWGHH